jgi:hypothetical protein
MWIVAGITLLAGMASVAYLLKKAGGELKKQEERDLQSNYQYDSKDDEAG